MLTERTIAQRMQKLLAQMAREGYATLIIYGDVEHSGNFEYLTGFMTRFEEGLLVLHADGRAALLVGNENIKLARHCRIPAQVLHCPMPSLPNQPMTGQRPPGGTPAGCRRSAPSENRSGGLETLYRR